MYNVLIVDDEQYALDGMMGSVHWEQLGFNSPFTALGVASAKQVLTENIIDIMLCDIEMPGESGLNLLKWIQENQLATVCILVTCHEEFDYAREAIQLRAFDYLVKPVYARKLEEVLQKAKNELKKTGKSTSSMIRQEGSLNSRLIRKICLYIEEHVTEDLTRQSVAGHFSLNPDHLNRIFKAEINKTILDYIITEDDIRTGFEEAVAQLEEDGAIRFPDTEARAEFIDDCVSCEIDRFELFDSDPFAHHPDYAVAVLDMADLYGYTL